jgi:MFS family permease
MGNPVKRIPNARWLYILPACFLVNFFAFMDRQVISIALPGGMMHDLGLNATLAGFAAGISAIGYLLLQVEGGQLAQQGRAKKFVGYSIFVWSILSILTAYIQNEWHLYVVRFLLGFSEGGLSPAITTLITYWFPDKNGERAKANSVFYTALSTAMILMGPLAGAIISAYNWQILFVVLGAVSLLTGVLWFATICERPEDAKWLSEEERDYIVNTINAERALVKQHSQVEIKAGKVPLSVLLTNKYVTILCVIVFFVNVGQFGFGMWMPTLIKNITKGNILSVGWLTVLPNLAVMAGLWTWTYIAKKVPDRRLTTAIPQLCFGVALAASPFVPLEPIIAIGMMCIVAFFLQGHMPSYYTLPSLLLVKELDGPARGLIGLASGIGAFVGPYGVGYLITLTGSTNAGMYFMGACLVAGCLVSFALPKNLGVDVTAVNSKGVAS